MAPFRGTSGDLTLNSSDIGLVSQSQFAQMFIATQVLTLNMLLALFKAASDFATKGFGFLFVAF